MLRPILTDNWICICISDKIYTHIWEFCHSYNEKVELVVCYKSSKKQESLAGQNGAADNKIDQVLRYELGRITSHPFRKLWQTEQPTNQPTDQQNNQPNDQHKYTNQPMDMKAHREVTLTFNKRASV